MKHNLIFAYWCMLVVSANLMSMEESTWLMKNFKHLSKPLKEKKFINSLFQQPTPCSPAIQKDYLFSAEEALVCAVEHDELQIANSLLNSSLILSSSPVDLSMLLHKSIQRNNQFKHIKDAMRTNGYRFANDDPFILKFQKNESIISLLKLKQTQAFHQAIKERDIVRVAQFLQGGASIIYLTSGKNALERANELLTTELSKDAYAEAWRIMTMLIKRRNKRFFDALYKGDVLGVQQMINLGANGLTKSNRGAPAIMIAKSLFSKPAKTSQQIARGEILTMLQMTILKSQKEKRD